MTTRGERENREKEYFIFHFLGEEKDFKSDVVVRRESVWDLKSENNLAWPDARIGEPIREPQSTVLMSHLK